MLRALTSLAGFWLVAKKLLVKKLHESKQEKARKMSSTVSTAKMKNVFFNFAICFLVMHWINCYKPKKVLEDLFALFWMVVTILSLQ